MNKILKILILLFIKVLLISCITLDESPPSQIDKELYPYVVNFKDLAKYYGAILAVNPNTLKSVRFEKKNELEKYGKDIIGVCLIHKTYCYSPSSDKYFCLENGREIIVKRPEKFDHAFLVLMYHELGHCLLNKPHSCNSEDIMYPYITENVFKNLNKSIERLFINENIIKSNYCKGDF